MDSRIKNVIMLQVVNLFMDQFFLILPKKLQIHLNANEFLIIRIEIVLFAYKCFDSREEG